MRVKRAVISTPFEIQLALGGPEPSLADGRVGIDGSLENDFPVVRVKYAQYQEKIRITCG